MIRQSTSTSAISCSPGQDQTAVLGTIRLSPKIMVFGLMKRHWVRFLDSAQEGRPIDRRLKALHHRFVTGFVQCRNPSKMVRSRRFSGIFWKVPDDAWQEWCRRVGPVWVEIKAGCEPV